MQELNLAVLSAKNLHSYLGTLSESRGHSRDYVEGAINEATAILNKVDTKGTKATVFGAEVVFGTVALITLIANINALEITTPAGGNVLQGILGYVDIIKHWEPSSQGEEIIRNREALRPFMTLLSGGIAIGAHLTNNAIRPNKLPVVQK